MTTERKDPAQDATERVMLDSWLDFHRATLAMKCAGLSDEQMRERAVPPSALSLLGLVRHMADVERNWFRRAFDDGQTPPLYYSDEYPDGEFDLVEDADAAADFACWRRECQHARDISADVPLDATATLKSGTYTLRWILFHMIEEYARHNGHADLLRERIDGAVGL